MDTIPIDLDNTTTATKKPRCKHNNYFLSICVTEHLENVEQAKRLADQLNDIVKKKLMGVISYLTVKDSINTEATLNAKWIKHINLQTDIQLDPRFNRPISYVMVAVTHYTSIKFDVKQFKKDISNELGHSINVSHKLFKDAKPDFNNYMLKNTI